MQKKEKRSNPLLTALKVLCILTIVPVVALIAFSATSLIGRIQIAQAIPQRFLAYIQIPKPVQTASNIVAAQSLQKLLTEPGINALAPVAAELRETGILQNFFVRTLANPPLHAALLTDQTFIGIADAGFLSAWLRFLPFAVSLLEIPEISTETHNGHLFYKYQPLETQNTPPIYITIQKNLVLITAEKPALLLTTLNNLELKENKRPSYQFKNTKFDVGILLSPQHIQTLVSENNPLTTNILSTLEFGEFAEITISLLNNTLQTHIAIPVTSENADIQPLLLRNSTAPALYTLLPQETQYATLIGAGKLQNLLTPAISYGGSEIQKTWRDASNASKNILNISLEDLLFSWTGSEFAVFALAGRQQNVFAVQVANEKQRKIIFEKAFSSLVITEDSSAVIDGIRIPQIKVPPYLLNLLRLWNINTPAPYYIEQNGFVFFSESPENLIATVNAIKKNQLLIREQKWKDLAHGRAARSSFSLFYSLDRAVPFFLRGNSLAEKTLKLYRNGLAEISLSKGYITATLTVAAGEDSDMEPLGGFPLTMNGDIDTDIDVVLFQKRGESRIIAVENERMAVSINPTTAERYEYQFSENIWIRSAQNLKPKTAKEKAIWILGDRGTIALASGDLEIDTAFPISSGVRVSGSPVITQEGYLVFIDSENFLHTITDKAEHTKIELPFNEQVRSRPEFIYTKKETYIAVYPRSFFAQLWLLDSKGKALPGWPLPVSGISNAAPVFAQSLQGPTIGLLTQAGEFSQYTIEGDLLKGFPVNIADVFTVQPIFDGSSFWALSETGTLYQITQDAQIRSQKIDGLTAKNGYLVQTDTDQDKRSELYFSGDGNVLFGYNTDFTVRNGFPLSAWGKPIFGDFNGDGIIEILSATMQNTIVAWQLR